MAANIPARISEKNRIDELERKVNMNSFSIQQALDDINRFVDRAKMNFLEIEKKFISLEPYLEKISAAAEVERKLANAEHALAEKIKSIENLVRLLEVEIVKLKRQPQTSHIAATPTIYADIERRLHALESNRSTEKTSLHMDTKENISRLNAIENNLLATQAKLRSEIARLENLIGGRALTEAAASDIIRRTREEIAELKKDIMQAELLKAEIFSRQKDFAMKSDFENFQNFVKSKIDEMVNVIDRVTALERSLDTRLVKMDEKIREDIESLKHSVDTAIVRVEEKMTEIVARESIAAVKPELERMKKEISMLAENNQPEVIRSHIRQLESKYAEIEKDIELKATRILTKELSDFASILDKKFPDLATKRDFHDFANKAEARINAIEAPNLSPIITRIDAVESRLSEISSLIRAITGRVPIVIE